jgi:hypothetical protein
MRDIELRHIEEIVIAISSAEKRIIGFSSLESDGFVALAALGVGEFLARSGRPVLLIDVQQPIGSAHGDVLTLPDMLASGNIVHKEQALDTVTVRPSQESRYVFADIAQFRMVLESLLEDYHYVILQLAPVLTPPAAMLNALPIGAACDYLLLTCHRGSTGRPQLGNVMDKLRGARCVVGGIILNETAYSSPGAEIANVASWFLWPLPWLRKRVQKWAMSTDLLN